MKNLPCGRLGQVAAIRMREHQVGEAAIVPCRPQCFPLCFLLFLVLLQHLEDRRSGSDGAGLAVLRRRKPEDFAFLSRLGQLFGDSDQTVLKVHRIPGQPQQLTGPQSGENCGHDERFMLVAFQKGQQLGQFRRIQGMDFRLLDPGQDAVAGWILAQVADPDSHIQCLMQAAVNVLDGFRTEPFLPLLIVEALNHGRSECRQFDVSERGDDVHPDLHFVGIGSAELHIPQVVAVPHGQPLTEGQAAVLSEITMVDGDGDFGQFLPDFRLGSAIDRMPFSIGTVSGFPVSVSPFSDGSFAVSTLSCHSYLLPTASP